MSAKTYTGGCQCGALRYEADGEPTMTGHCYCCDCRRASGSGFIPFLSFPSDAVRFTGEPREFRSSAASGREAVRNRCPVCGSLVFGGEIGNPRGHTIYAGSLDEPSRFVPRVAIFARDRPAWAIIPSGLTIFDGLPS